MITSRLRHCLDTNCWIVLVVLPRSLDDVKVAFLTVFKSQRAKESMRPEEEKYAFLFLFLQGIKQKTIEHNQ